MLVVNTNERLSEGDETPCSLYCKLTLEEDSPGSLAQGKPRDKVNPIHHSPTPAQELLVPLHPHPPPTDTSIKCQAEFISSARKAAARAESLDARPWVYMCVGGGAWKYGIYLCQFSQQSSGKHSKCGSYEVRASHMCHLPHYFRSKENRVNFLPWAK